MENNKPVSKIKIFITIITVIILGVIILSFKEVKNLGQYSFVDEKNPGFYKAEIFEEVPIIQKDSTAPIDSLTEKTLSYSDVVSLYGDKRIQFDTNCVATPKNASFLVGTMVVLDNRSDTLKAVKFINDTYAIPPFHVRIIELDRQGIFSIDCDTSKNVSIIRVN
jgi:hypothetical protein